MRICVRHGKKEQNSEVGETVLEYIFALIFNKLAAIEKVLLDATNESHSTRAIKSQIKKSFSLLVKFFEVKTLIFSLFNNFIIKSGESDAKYILVSSPDIRTKFLISESNLLVSGFQK